MAVYPFEIYRIFAEPTFTGRYFLTEYPLANRVELADIPEESGEDILVSDVLGGLEGHCECG